VTVSAGSLPSGTPDEKLIRARAGLLGALRERDENTFAHCDRTCALCVQTGRMFGLSSQDLAVLRRAAELHDIGKMGIPDRVLLKPGRLDDEELAVMRTHSRRGHDMLASIQDARVAPIATIVLHHHEAIDGNGYPEGLRGEDIPVLARILSIVDSYDAIASVRPYHAPKSHVEVMRMLHEEQGRKYDPYVLATFSKIVDFSPYRAAS
jgi:HD-GYP domain-containing protein (c-di-GMP phosphodiesterase class II)